MPGFWERTSQQRLSRRRALAATGSAAAAAAFLAACGGGGDSSDSGGAKKETSSLVAKPEDTTKQARRGGTLKFHVTADIPNFDPHSLSLANREQVLVNYNRLTRVKPGILQSSDGTISGDALESWEFSPDKLTVTMKVRPTLGTPNVAPVNGRIMDSSDVIFSWERWTKNGTNRADLANSVNPNAPVLSVTAPDAKTVVVKLKEPLASIMAGFSNFASGNYYVIPKEAESQVDLRRTPIGAGVYYLAEYVPSSRFVYKRNPNYWDKNTAFAETVEVPIVSENATGVAQLKAGGLFTYPVVADSIIQTKNDAPEINLYQTEIAAGGITAFFGQKAGSDKSPFRDARVRQAYSMSMDRDLFVDTWGNVSKFAAQGVPVDSVWNSAVPASDFRGWPLDPKSKDFGATASFFQKNIAEAKKLLAAAGFANGITVIANQIGDASYGPNYAKYIEVQEGFAGETGFKFTKAIQGYATNWMPEFRDSHGFFDGIAYRLTPRASDPGDQLYAEYNKNGSVYYGFDADGKGIAAKEGPFAGDPTCNDLTNKMRTEFDDAKRKAYGQDLQRYLGKQQYMMSYLGSWTGFQLAWPAVRNWRMLSGNDSSQTWASYWLDDTLPPLKKS